MTIRQKLFILPVAAIGLALAAASPTLAQDAAADEHAGHHSTGDAAAGAPPPSGDAAAPAMPEAGSGHSMMGQGMMDPGMCPMMAEMMKQMMGHGMGQGRGMMGQGMMGQGMPGQGMPGDGMMDDDDDDMMGMMGPGMKGPGMMRHGRMPRGMMDQGMMGQGMMGDGIGPALIYGLPPMGQELTVDAVRQMLERQLAIHGNPRLKLGAVTADTSSILAEIVTVDGSLVQKLAFDRFPGAVRQVQ